MKLSNEDSVQCFSEVNNFASSWCNPMLTCFLCFCSLCFFITVNTMPMQQGLFNIKPDFEPTAGTAHCWFLPSQIGKIPKIDCVPWILIDLWQGGELFWRLSVPDTPLTSKWFKHWNGFRGAAHDICLSNSCVHRYTTCDSSHQPLICRCLHLCVIPLVQTSPL